MKLTEDTSCFFRRLALVAGVFAVMICNLPAYAGTGAAGLQRQVEAVERAFARTMADRDFDAFVSFLSEETVFLAGTTALRGRQQVADHWRQYYEAAEAPFSWQPETVQVLESGTLALSTGPVYNTEGRLFSRYTSIWRQEKPGVWRIIFDKGNKACD